MQDLALTPDAARVVVACASPYHHQAFRTADLADDGRYTTSSYPNQELTLTGKLDAPVGFGTGSAVDIWRLDDPLAGEGTLIGSATVAADGHGQLHRPSEEVGLHDRVCRIVKADFVLGDRMPRSAWRAASSLGLGYLM
ncbi:hypothetical protein [Streptomyces sp. NPDC058086]|uniref:hypothetical protein n=1 Tax=Streptomyces sp. NPDC058086 TaxID=3346334 RepID=UPI0036E51167